MGKCNHFYRMTMPALFCLCISPVFAQQNLTVHLNGTAMRQPLDLVAGANTVTLCGLTPGNTYSVIANGAVYEQKIALKLSAGFTSIQSPDRPNALRFTASESCATLNLSAESADKNNTFPAFLSIKCADCPQENTWLRQFEEKAGATVLSTTGGVSASSLISNTLVGGNCFEVSNVTFTGSATSRGTFNNGGTSIGISEGMVLCTGNVNILPGPNDEDNANGGFGNNTPNDTDLESIAGGNQWDKSAIEFDFTPTANTVQFDFVFGSEEYCEYVGTQFNDVFGFFISGPGISGNLNLAKLPNGTKVATNNVNHLTNSAFYVNNTPNDFNCLFQPAYSPYECQLDGWTKVLTATANVQPCQTYHIKLAIADISDDIFSSAVFLRANSFNAGGAANAASVYPAGLGTGYENCSVGGIRFVRDNADQSAPLNINFTVGGTATPGLDYAPITSPVTIPAGQNEIIVPVNILDDTQTEGPESIVLTLNQPCSCQQSEITFNINDKPPFSAVLTDQIICAGEPFTLQPLTTGLSPFTYTWNTGASTSNIEVTTSGTFTVTVTDVCGSTTIALSAVSALQQPVVRDTTRFCPGDTVTVQGISYIHPAEIANTLPASVGCDTLMLTTLLYSTPAPSVVGIHCPDNLAVVSTDPVNVDYGLPTAESDCTCPGLLLERAAGLEPGAEFPVGVTQVCYSATDSCGHSSSCCFSVTVAEEAPCDIKENGCMKWELMRITQNSAGYKTYFIRVTNNCASGMVYTAFEVPNGLLATQPQGYTEYTAPSGNVYKVRNPNSSPFHSIRFSTVGQGLSNGASDLFWYTLPPQTSPAYIHVISKLSYSNYYEAHMNTYYCPVELTDNPKPATGMRQLRVFPNPTNGDQLWVDLSEWSGENTTLIVFDSRAQLLKTWTVDADTAPQQIALPAALTDGLYFLEAFTAGGKREALRFVVKH